MDSIEDTGLDVIQRSWHRQRAIDLSGAASNDLKELRLLKMVQISPPPVS